MCDRKTKRKNTAISTPKKRMPGAIDEFSPAAFLFRTGGNVGDAITQSP